MEAALMALEPQEGREHRALWDERTRFGDICREIRELELHISVEDLAIYYADDPDAPRERTWRGWELDEHTPSRKHFRWLCRTFELEPAYLRRRVRAAELRQARRRRIKALR